MREPVLWVARDNHDVFTIWQRRPRWRGMIRRWGFGGWCFEIPDRWFPDLKPGECRRVTLTMEPPDA